MICSRVQHYLSWWLRVPEHVDLFVYRHTFCVKGCSAVQAGFSSGAWICGLTCLQMQDTIVCKGTGLSPVNLTSLVSEYLDFVYRKRTYQLCARVRDSPPVNLTSSGCIRGLFCTDKVYTSCVQGSSDWVPGLCVPVEDIPAVCKGTGLPPINSTSSDWIPGLCAPMGDIYTSCVQGYRITPS